MRAKAKQGNHAPRARAKKGKGPDRGPVAALAEEIIEWTVLTLIREPGRQGMAAVCAKHWGVEARVAEEAVAEARTRIRAAAGFDRAEEIGLAKKRCEAIFTQCLKKAPRVALEACKEVNKLLALHGAQSEEGALAGSDELRTEMEAIKGYLAPLALGDESLPLSELVRRAVGKIGAQ